MNTLQSAGRGVEPLTLQFGAYFRCNICGNLHVIMEPKGSPITAAQEFCYVFCLKPRPGVYFIGTVGGVSRRGVVEQPIEDFRS